MDKKNTYWNTKQAIAFIVESYRRAYTKKPGRMLPLRDFAIALCKGTDFTITYQTIKNWQDCRHMPDQFLLAAIRIASPSPFAIDFCCDVLGVLGETVPMTVIGEEAARKFLG